MINDLKLLSKSALYARLKQDKEPAAFAELLRRVSVNPEDDYLNNLVGYCYSMGCGTEIDYLAGKPYYLKAVEKNSPVAAANLGYNYTFNDHYGPTANFSMAAYWWLKAAIMASNTSLARPPASDVSNHIEVKASIGICHLQGYLKQFNNPQEGVLLLQEAAEAGSALAKIGLFQAYQMGKGVTQNSETALSYLFQAIVASLNNAEWLEVLSTSFAGDFPLVTALFEKVLEVIKNNPDAEIHTKKILFFNEAFTIINNFSTDELKKWKTNKIDLSIASSSSDDGKKTAILELGHYSSTFIIELLRNLIKTPEDKPLFSPYLPTLITLGYFDAALTLAQAGASPIQENTQGKNAMHAIATAGFPPDLLSHLFNNISLWCRKDDNLDLVKEYLGENFPESEEDKLLREQCFFKKLIFSLPQTQQESASAAHNPFTLAVRTRDIDLILMFLEKLGLINNLSCYSEQELKDIQTKLATHVDGLGKAIFEISYEYDSHELNELALAAGSSTVIHRMIQQEEKKPQPDKEEIIALYFRLAKEAVNNGVLRKHAYEKLVELSEGESASMSALYHRAQCLEFGYGVEQQLETARALYLQGKENNQELFDSQTKLRNENIIDSLYSTAKESDNEDACKQAFEQLLKLESHTYPDDGYTKNIVGCCYYNGYGVVADIELANKQFTQAKNDGNLRAIANIGRYHVNMQNYNAGIPYLLEAALKGYPPAMETLKGLKKKGRVEARLALAEYYFEKYNIADNSASALFHFGAIAGNELAKTSDRQKAYYYLAQMYELGKGVAVDINKAADNYAYTAKLTEKQNDNKNVYGELAFEALLRLSNQDEPLPKVLNELGLCYYQFCPSHQNYETSFTLFTQAAKLGSNAAMRNLAYSYANGNGTAVDISEAAKWLLKSVTHAEATDDDKKRSFKRLQDLANTVKPAKEVLAVLGICYFYGHGTAKNEPKAVDYLTQAAEAGSDVACYHLAMIYEQGCATLAVNITQASRRYQQAAKSNGQAPDSPGVLAISALQRLAAAHPTITTIANNLAYCYQHAQSVVQNVELALHWYTQAAEAGSYSAMFNLAYCYAKGNNFAKNIPLALEWALKAIAATNNAVSRNKYYKFLQDISELENLLIDLDQVTEHQRNHFSTVLTQGVRQISPAIFPLIGLLIKLGATLLPEGKEDKVTLLNQALLFIDKIQSTDLAAWGTIVSQLPDSGSSSSASVERADSTALVQLISHLKSELLKQLLPIFTKEESAQLQVLLANFLIMGEDACATTLAQAKVLPNYNSSGNNLLHIMAKRNDLTIAQADAYLRAFTQAADNHFVEVRVFSDNISDVSPLELAIANNNYFVIVAFLFHLNLISTLDVTQEETLTHLGDLYHSNTLQHLASLHRDKEESALLSDRYENIAKARDFYERAAELGDDVAKLKLAESYMQGPAPDITKAVSWYIKAAQGAPNTATPLNALYKLRELAEGNKPDLAAKEYILSLIPSDPKPKNELLYDSLIKGDFITAQKIATSGASLLHADATGNNIFHRFAKRDGNNSRDIEKFFIVVEQWLEHDKTYQAKEFYADLLMTGNAEELEETPLMLAAKSGNKELVNEFCQRLGWNELHWAVYINDEALAKNIATDIDKCWQKDGLDRTPLRLALQLNRWKCLIAALPKTALSSSDPKCKGLGEYLYRAVNAGEDEAAERLLELNATIDWHIPKKDSDEVNGSAHKNIKSPEPLLHVAVATRNIKMLELLLTYVASDKIDLKKKNTAGLTVTGLIDSEILNIKSRLQDARKNLATYDSVSSECASELTIFNQMKERIAETVAAKASSSWLSRMVAPKPKSGQVPQRPPLGSSAAKLEGYIPNL